MKHWWEDQEWAKEARLFFPKEPDLGRSLVVLVPAGDPEESRAQKPMGRLRLYVGGSKALECRPRS